MASPHGQWINGDERVPAARAARGPPKPLAVGLPSFHGGQRVSVSDRDQGEKMTFTNRLPYARHRAGGLEIVHLI